MARLLPCRAGTLLEAGFPGDVVGKMLLSGKSDKLEILVVSDCCAVETPLKVVTVEGENVMEGDDSMDVGKLGDNEEKFGDVASVEGDDGGGGGEDAMNWDSELVVGDESEVGPTPLEEDAATEFWEGAAGARGDVVGNTVAVAITDVSVEAGTVLALSDANKLNCLEKDVVEVPDKEARSNGGFPGELGMATTEPICLPVRELDGLLSVAEGDVETSTSKGDEVIVDAVEIGVGFPVATPCPTRLVGIACKLVGNTSAPCVKLCTELPEAGYAAEDRGLVYVEELETAPAAIERLDDCAANSGMVD